MPDNDEVIHILHGLCACLIGRGAIDADSLREDLERRVSLRKTKHNIDSPALTDFIEHLKRMAVEKRDVDARIAVSLGTAIESSGSKN